MNIASKMKTVSENAKKNLTQFFINGLFSEIEHAANQGDDLLVKTLDNRILIEDVKKALVKEGFEVKTDNWISHMQIKIYW